MMRKILLREAMGERGEGMGGAQASGGYLGSVWGGLSEGKRMEARDGSEAVGANFASCEVGLGQGRNLETEASGVGPGLMRSAGGLSRRGSQRSSTQPACFTKGN